MPTYPQNWLYSQFYTNSTTTTSTYLIPYWDTTHRQTGSTSVANSPYVIDDWRAWNTSTCTSTIYTSTQLWQDWCIQGTATYTTQTYNSSNSVYQQYPLREPTEEERKATEAAEKKRAQARRRAKSLLDSLLTSEQKEYMERHGYIPVLGSKGRRYHVRTEGSASGNVALVDEAGLVSARFCAHPTCTHDGRSIPKEDQFLAQVLHLQDDEDDFLSKANTNQGINPVARHPLQAVA